MPDREVAVEPPGAHRYDTPTAVVLAVALPVLLPHVASVLVIVTDNVGD